MIGHAFSIEDLRYWYPGANRKKLKRIQRLMRSHGLRSGESPHGFMMRYGMQKSVAEIKQALAEWMTEKITESVPRFPSGRFRALHMQASCDYPGARIHYGPVEFGKSSNTERPGNHGKDH